MPTPNAHEQFIRQPWSPPAKPAAKATTRLAPFCFWTGKSFFCQEFRNTDRDPTGHAETNLVACAIREFPAKDLGRGPLHQL